MNRSSPTAFTSVPVTSFSPRSSSFLPTTTCPIASRHHRISSPPRRCRSLSLPLLPPTASAAPTWERVRNCDVVVPSSSTPPRAIVHFAGGLGAGAAPATLYRAFLERLASRGNVVVFATPVGATFDHDQIALGVARQSADVSSALAERFPGRPVFGVGHSLGAKILALSACDAQLRALLGPRAANVLLAFNNYSAQQSIPAFDQLRDVLGRGTAGIPPEIADVIAGVREAGSSAEALRGLGVPAAAADWVAAATRGVAGVAEGIGAGGFTPAAAEVRRRVEEEYAVERTLVIKYARDTIDCSTEIMPLLKRRFGEGGVVLREMAGTHVTPNTPDIDAASMRSTGFDVVDAGVRGAADASVVELDDTITVIVAFITLNLQLLDQRLLAT